MPVVTFPNVSLLGVSPTRRNLGTSEFWKDSFCHYRIRSDGLDRGLPAVRDSRLTPLLSGAMNVWIRIAVNTMLETKFLRLRTPVELGSRFDDWQVCWLGGWGKHRLFYLVMVVRVEH